MTLALDPTVGGPSANTYASIAETDAYAEGSAYAVSWATQSTAQKTGLLVRAVRTLDTLRFPGRAVESAQARQWPRCGVDDPAGCAYDTDAIPPCVIDAQMLLACWLSSLAATAADPFGGLETNGLESIVVDKIELVFRDQAETGGADFMNRSIRPILRAGGCLAAAGTVQLLR